MTDRDPETNKPLCHYCHKIVENTNGYGLSEQVGFFHTECVEQAGNPDNLVYMV